MKYFTKGADPFVPHGFAQKVELLGALPRVLVTREVYSRMWHFVDIANGEVGWLGAVEKLPSGDFFISEVFLLKQEVSAVTTEMSADGVAELAEELLSTRNDGVEIVNKLMFWGHSHVRMGTSPSGQDETQMELFRSNGCPWFIRGILNKLGRMEFTIFCWETGMKIVDACWALYEPVDEGMRSEVEAEFAAKVSELRFPLPTTPGPWQKIADEDRWGKVFDTRHGAGE